ncbi:glycosyltransferase family 9 protein [candidate division KSB1 bacterium]|nr:glycosyltransferase family 9 protein [candidate division KSB1 bacterium]
MHKTLVLAISRMGDLVQSGPFLRRLKRRDPDGELHLLVEECFRDVAAMLPAVDQIHTVRLEHLLPALASGANHDLPSAISHYRDYLRELRGEAFDSVWNLTHTRPATLLNYLLVGEHGMGVTLDRGGLQRVNAPWLRYFFATNLARPWCQFNLVDIYANCVRDVDWRAERFLRLNVPQVEQVAGLAVTKSTRPPRLAIHPGASHRSKCWPVASYVRLARELRARWGAELIIIGGPRDSDLAEAFAGSPGVVSLIGRTNIPELTTVLESCDLLITNDSGPMHLAAAVRTQVIAITVGTALASETAPYGSGHYVVEPTSECFPCLPQRPCAISECARTVSVETISALAQAALSSVAPAADDLSAARVFRTVVNPTDALLDLEPLNREARDRRWELNHELRPMWIYAMESAMGPATPDPVTTTALIEAARKALAAASAARSSAVELVHISRRQPLQVRRCSELGGRIERAERTIAATLKNGGPLEALWNFHQLGRSSLAGVTLAEQSTETLALYEWLCAILAVIAGTPKSPQRHLSLPNPLLGVQP